MGKYKEEYCQMLLDHMENGLSFEAFGGIIDVHRATLHRWRERHDEFREAYEIGWTKSLLFWERIGIDGALGKINNFNAAAYCFNKKNRFGWRDRTEITTDEKGISINIDKDDAKL